MNRTAELVEKWIAKAERDFVTASTILDKIPDFDDVICYHCQQAAEKYIKAYLICLNIDFGKIHSLTELVKKISNRPDYDKRLNGLVEGYEGFAVDVRYPEIIDKALPKPDEVLMTTIKIKEILLPLIRIELKKLNESTK